MHFSERSLRLQFGRWHRTTRLIVLVVVAVVASACSQLGASQSPATTAPTANGIGLVRDYQPPSVPIYALATHASKPEVVIYGAPGGSGPVTILLTGLYVPFPISIDAHQTVYVADYGEASSHRHSSVTEWRASRSGPIRTITDGIAYPISIAAAAGGRLDVANDFGGKYGTVTVYDAKSVRPSRTITKGIKAPSSIAVDTSGYTYVANTSNVCSSGAETVTEYSPKSDMPSVVIRPDFCGSFQVTVDSSDHLYVADSGAQFVLEYAKHSATLIRTLSLAKHPSWGVVAIAFDVLGEVYVAARESVGSRYFGEIAEFGASGQRPKHTIKFPVGVFPTSITTDRYANLYAIVGKGSSDVGSGIECNESCSLIEFPSGLRSSVIIARSNKTSMIKGPIAVAP